MIITKNQFEILDSFTYEFDEMTIEPAYSGRNMFGKTCIGFISEAKDLFQMGFALALYLNSAINRKEDDEKYRLEMEELIDILAEHSACIDSLGKDYIVYFPMLQYDDLEPHPTRYL